MLNGPVVSISDIGQYHPYVPNTTEHIHCMISLLLHPTIQNQDLGLNLNSESYNLLRTIQV